MINVQFSRTDRSFTIKARNVEGITIVFLDSKGEIIRLPPYPEPAEIRLSDGKLVPVLGKFGTYYEFDIQGDDVFCQP